MTTDSTMDKVFQEIFAKHRQQFPVAVKFAEQLHQCSTILRENAENDFDSSVAGWLEDQSDLLLSRAIEQYAVNGYVEQDTEWFARNYQNELTVSTAVIERFSSQ